MKYISIDTIFAALTRDIKNYDVSSADVIEWCADALEAIQSPSVYENSIAFSEVVGHQCNMPSNLHVLLQIARNNFPDDTLLTPASVITDATIETPDIPVALDENGTPINDYELAYYRPYFDLISEYNILGYNSSYKSKFTPVRLANSTFFNTVVAKESTEFLDMYKTCEDEYTIIEDALRFSFETGKVAISYLRQKVDCVTGYPMILDTYSNKRAVIAFVRYKLKEIDFYNNREGSDSRFIKAEQDWQWYCRQAKNENTMPQTIDEWENLFHQRNYIMPNTNRYYGFFGKLAHGENRNLMHYGRR